ncbi:MAG TPA: sigma-70 family RNA polymerase sigma factor, partial [Planctomycetaceae bacterium]|nr:sigma-70 family RNA polymerase sigma factor [Planctomycetaceae bacterium]
MLDDAALLIQFSQDSSEEAFRELVRRHLNFVFSTALRQLARDTHLAEDVAQSVFADLARKAREISSCPVLARWLYTSTHHAAAKAVRTEQRRRTRESIAQAVQDLANEPAHDAEWARIRPWLDEALRGLGQRDRDAILLRFFEARSFAAIGSQLGLNENAARMRVERALEKLRGILSRRGVTSTAVALAAMLSNEAVVAAPAGMAGTIADAALACTAGGSGAAAAFLQIMSTTKLGIGAVAVVVAVAAGLGVYEFSANRRTDAALSSAQRQYDADAKQLQELRNRAGVVDRNRADLERAIAGQRARQAPGNAVADARSTIKGSSTASRQPSVKPAAVTDPKIRNNLEVWFEGLSAIQFGPFFRNAGFSAEQREQMLDLLTLQKTLALGSVVVSLRPDSVSAEQISQEIQDFVGTADAQRQYQDYIRTMNLRPVAAALAANLASTGTPLTADQGEQLTQILASNSPPG